jgi:hypothetical protein
MDTKGFEFRMNTRGGRLWSLILILLSCSSVATSAKISLSRRQNPAISKTRSRCKKFSIAPLSDKPWGMGKWQSVGIIQSSRKAKFIHGVKVRAVGRKKPCGWSNHMQNWKGVQFVLTHVLMLNVLRSHRQMVKMVMRNERIESGGRATRISHPVARTIKSLKTTNSKCNTISTRCTVHPKLFH